MDFFNDQDLQTLIKYSGKSKYDIPLSEFKDDLKVVFRGKGVVTYKPTNRTGISFSISAGVINKLLPNLSIISINRI